MSNIALIKRTLRTLIQSKQIREAAAKRGGMWGSDYVTLEQNGEEVSKAFAVLFPDTGDGEEDIKGMLRFFATRDRLMPQDNPYLRVYR